MLDWSSQNPHIYIFQSSTLESVCFTAVHLHYDLYYISYLKASVYTTLQWGTVQLLIHLEKKL